MHRVWSGQNDSQVIKEVTSGAVKYSNIFRGTETECEMEKALLLIWGKNKRNSLQREWEKVVSLGNTTAVLLSMPERHTLNVCCCKKYHCSHSDFICYKISCPNIQKTEPPKQVNYFCSKTLSLPYFGEGLLRGGWFLL